MDDNRITGAAREAYGNVQDAVGAVTGSDRLRARGAYQQARGEVESAAGSLADGVREQPFMAIMIGVALGYLLGRLRIV